MSQILGDKTFQQYASMLKLYSLIPSDPDKKVIEKAFRKCALKTHPDKGGDPKEFRKINDAYNKLMSHANFLEIIEAETEQSQTSVIIEISKQSVATWTDKLKFTYGRPRVANVRNTIFEGPYKQFKGRGGSTGPITVVVYEDPEDGVPKIHCKCENYMAWMQQQNFPLHLHVQNNKKIMFDQWRIMSMAEFGFCKVKYGSSARHSWREHNEARMKQEEDNMVAQKLAAEERKRKKQEEEEEDLRKKEEEEMRRNQEQESPEKGPWWERHTGGCRDFHMGETTPPPEDLIPVYDDTSNTYSFEKMVEKGDKEGNCDTNCIPEPKADVMEDLSVDSARDILVDEVSADHKVTEDPKVLRPGGSKPANKKADVPKVKKNKSGIRKCKNEDTKGVRRSSIFKSMEDAEEAQKSKTASADTAPADHLQEHRRPKSPPPKLRHQQVGGASDKENVGLTKGGDEFMTSPGVIEPELVKKISSLKEKKTVRQVKRRQAERKVQKFPAEGDPLMAKQQLNEINPDNSFHPLRRSRSVRNFEEETCKLKRSKSEVWRKVSHFEQIVHRGGGSAGQLIDKTWHRSTENIQALVNKFREVEVHVTRQAAVKGDERSPGGSSHRQSDPNGNDNQSSSMESYIKHFVATILIEGALRRSEAMNRVRDILLSLLNDQAFSVDGMQRSTNGEAFNLRSEGEKMSVSSDFKFQEQLGGSKETSSISQRHKLDHRIMTSWHLKPRRHFFFRRNNKKNSFSVAFQPKFLRIFSPKTTTKNNNYLLRVRDVEKWRQDLMINGQVRPCRRQQQLQSQEDEDFDWDSITLETCFSLATHAECIEVLRRNESKIDNFVQCLEDKYCT